MNNEKIFVEFVSTTANIPIISYYLYIIPRVSEHVIIDNRQFIVIKVTHLMEFKTVVIALDFLE